MKKIHNKGFTLVELLAMLTVLGILMVVVIPNISQILKNNRVNKYKTDARKMVDSAKTKLAISDYYKANELKNDDAIVYSLDYLDTNDDIKKGPNGGEYDQFNSLVVCIKREDGFHYYVRLIEKYKGKYYGVDNAPIEDIGKVNAIKDIDLDNRYKQNNFTRESYRECRTECNLACDNIETADDADAIENCNKKQECKCIPHVVRWWARHSTEMNEVNKNVRLEVGDTSCPANSYRGIANAYADGTPCTEGDTCIPRSTCICYNDNEVYNGSQCVPKA